MTEYNYVMAFITLEGLPLIDFSGSEKWLMVEHSIRGWELPGGKPHYGETYEDAIVREVFEESGLTVYVRDGPLKYEDGLVYWMGVSKNNNGVKSNPHDPMIKSIKWYSSPPPNLAWGRAELELIIGMFNSG